MSVVYVTQWASSMAIWSLCVFICVQYLLGIYSLRSFDSPSTGANLNSHKQWPMWMKWIRQEIVHRWNPECKYALNNSDKWIISDFYPHSHIYAIKFWFGDNPFECIIQIHFHCQPEGELRHSLLCAKIQINLFTKLNRNDDSVRAHFPVWRVSRGELFRLPIHMRCLGVCVCAWARICLFICYCSRNDWIKISIYSTFTSHFRSVEITRNSTSV